MDKHFDVIIIGSGAGGGTLARQLAPSGKSILVLERGDWLPRELENWDAAATFVDNRYVSADQWSDGHGKSFQPQGADRGEGINRIFTDGIRRYRFETFIGPSRAGAFDALQLDYDNPGNPFFIRAIKDEIRRVAPGLYLGQAYLLTKKRARLVLYFGLALP